MNLGKYSFGIGDRFGHEGLAQLRAIEKAGKQGIEITPVWNKSNREHKITNTTPADNRKAADEAIKKYNWKKQFFVDADHINLSNVDWFTEYCDFYTIDVADYTGKKADKTLINQFIARNEKYIGKLTIPGIPDVYKLDKHEIGTIACKYLYAAKEAGRIYRHIENAKGRGNFITEISMDEVNDPQKALEIFFILSALADENIPVQTIAPKFSGRFNKGIDYEGNIELFAKDFEDDLLVIDYAIKEFMLPGSLKLSIHSGSDKFSIYQVIGKIINKHNKGIHLKTAGTTWLEEVIGLAIAGERPLSLVKKIACEALVRFDELSRPYATVIDINLNKLPSAADIKKWEGEKFANSLRHVPGHPDYNPDFRQLIHISYKIAAEYGSEFISYLENYSDIIGLQVTENLYDRHICKLFNL